MALGLLLGATGSWPMWGGEPTHRAVQSLRGAITSPRVKWKFEAGERVEW